MIRSVACAGSLTLGANLFILMFTRGQLVDVLAPYLSFNTNLLIECQHFDVDAKWGFGASPAFVYATASDELNTSLISFQEKLFLLWNACFSER